MENELDPKVLETIPPLQRPKHSSAGYQVLARKYFPVLSELEDVQLYRIHKSELLSAAQKLVLKYALSEKKLEKATFLQLCQGFEILNKAERLENNQSTENINQLFHGKLEINNLKE